MKSARLVLNRQCWEQPEPRVQHAHPPAVLQYNASLFLTVPDASAPAALTAAESLNEWMATTRFGEAQGLPTYSPVTGEGVLMADSSEINQQLYCGYRQVGVVARGALFVRTRDLLLVGYCAYCAQSRVWCCAAEGNSSL
jgi:hypothetical protein